MTGRPQLEDEDEEEDAFGYTLAPELEDEEEDAFEVDDYENDPDFVPQLAPGEIIVNGEPIDYAQSAHRLKANVWEQLATKRGIGGVHSGKVMLHLIEIGDEVGDRRLLLIDSRHTMKWAGGQMYIPMTRKITKKQQMNKNKDLPSLPAMVQNLMCSLEGPAGFNNSVLREKVRRCIRKLKDVFTAAGHETSKIHRSNSVRFEFFVYTKVGNMHSFPRDLAFSKILVMSKNNVFMQQFQGITKCCIDPLYKTFVENTANIDPQQFSEVTKGMLTICSELAVKLCEVFPFEGKLMQSVTKMYQFSGYQWFIPTHLLAPIPVIDAEITGLRVGLLPEVMRISLAAEDLKTDRPMGTDRGFYKLPVFIQMYSATLKLGVNHPITYLKSYLTMCNWIWHQIDRTQRDIDAEYSAPHRSVFLSPDFQSVSHCSTAKLKILVEKWCEIIVNAYDYEWFIIFQNMVRRHYRKVNKERGNDAPREAPPVLKRHQFPVTVNELERLIARFSIGGGVTIDVGSTYRDNKPDSNIEHMGELLLLFRKRAVAGILAHGMLALAGAGWLAGILALACFAPIIYIMAQKKSYFFFCAWTTQKKSALFFCVKLIVSHIQLFYSQMILLLL